MTEINTWVWIVDLDEMICRNPQNNVTVKLEKEGENIVSKLHDMPMALFGEISDNVDGEKIIMQIVKSAEEEYLRVNLNKNKEIV